MRLLRLWGIYRQLLKIAEHCPEQAKSDTIDVLQKGFYAS
jgi:hypothetical protein